MTDLATLVVRLEAETSQYQTQLAAATKQLQAFQSDVSAFANDVVGKFAAAFTVDKIAEFIEGSIESAAALEKLSQESGIAVEQLSALQAVFAQSGVGQDEMASSLKKLNQAVSDAAGNSSSKAAFAFQALGISVTNANGSLKTGAQLLPEIADAYSRLADGPNKVAINTDLLGKSALALIPTLNQGSEALNNLEQAARDSGATLTADLAQAADDLEKKFVALKQSFTGTISTEALDALLPELNAFADGLKTIGKEGTSTGAIIDVFAGVLKAVGTIILELEGEFKTLGAAFDGIENAAIAAGHGITDALSKAFKLDATGAVNALASTADKVGTILEDESDEAVRIQKATNDSIATLVQSGGKKQIDLTNDISAQIADSLKHAFDGLGDSQGVSPALLQQLDAAQKKVSEFADSIKAQASSFNAGSAATINFKLTTGAMGDAIALAHKDLDAMTSGVLPFNQALSDSANKTLAAASAARVYAADLQAKIDDKEVTGFTDKLQEQVDKFSLGDVAAVAYALTVGKLGDSLSRAKQTLADMTAGTIPFNQNIHDLAQATVDAADKAQKLSVQLTDDKDIAPLQAVSQQILTLGEHLSAAAAAGFQFQNALLIKNVTASGDQAGQQQLDTLKALTVAQAQYNELQIEFQRIQTTESQLEQSINDAVKSGQEDTLAGQAAIASARLNEVAQLGDVYNAMKAISDANAVALPGLVDKTNAANTAIKTLASTTNDLANKLRTDFEGDASDAFASFVTGAETASQAAHQFLTSFETELVKLATNKTLEDLFGATGQSGGGGIFGALASFFGGGSSGAPFVDSGVGSLDATNDLVAAIPLAGGGSLKAGQRAIVGEHGAEEFVPDVPGTIVPNSKMSQGMTVIQNFNVSVPGGVVSRQTKSQVATAAGGGISSAQRRFG